MKKITLLMTALVVLLLVSCKPKVNNDPVTPDPEPEPKKEKLSEYVTDQEKRDMLNSLETLDPNRLYVMNYTVDYRLDEAIAAQPTTVGELFDVLSGLLFDVKPENGSLTFDYGCSAYAATLKGTSEYLMGRNYDFCHMEGAVEAPATALVVFTAPKGGKKSINFVDAYWLRLHNDFYTSDTVDISNLMFAPYIITDGMNEDGLAISVLHLDGQPTDQEEEGKPNLYTSIAMRAVLDKCSTVDDAISFLEGYNMKMATPANGSLHFMLADATGDYSVVEWSFADPMHVDSTSVPTDFYALKGDEYRYVTNFYVDPRLESCIFGGGSNHGRDRYNVLKATLESYKYELTSVQAKSLLESVSQSPNPAVLTSHTQWSNLYNLTNRTVEMAILQEYGLWYQFSVTGRKR